MADFASDLFYHLPLPTIVICKCKRVLAANPAVEQLLAVSDLPMGHSGRICGRDCLQADELDHWKFSFEGGSLSWDSILERSLDPSKKVARDIAGFQSNTAFVRFDRPTMRCDSTEAAKPTMRHDSPVEDCFPSQDQHSTPVMTGAARFIETVRAKVVVSSWTYRGELHYILAFHDGYVIQQNVGMKPIDDSAQRERWLKDCREAIFDSVPLVGYIIDTKGDALHFNQLASALAGGIKIRSVSKRDGAATLWQEDFSRKLTYDELPGIRIINSRKELEPFRYGQEDLQTGRRYLLRGWGSCLYNKNDGEFLGAVVFSEVLGEYEETLERANNERLRSFETICDTMPHFVWTADENGYGDWFSSQWLEYTGRSLEQSVGWGWKETIHPEDLDHFTEVFRQAHDKAINYEVEARCQRHDGVYRWMLKRGAPIKDNAGKVLLWTGTNTEIHDTVMAKRHARHERDQIVRAMEQARVNVWAVNKNDRKLSFIEGNMIKRSHPLQRSQFQAARMTADQLAKVSWSAHMGGTELEKAVEDVMKGLVAKAEVELKWMDRWHKVWVIPEYADGTKDGLEEGTLIGVVGCSIDITDEKMRSVLESDNRQLSEEKHLAKEQSRMKSKFLANMSHEIRTPVAGVIGLANLLLDSDLDDEQRDHSEAIQMSAQTLLMIVNDILDFSKVESGKLTLEVIEFNLATLVTNLWKVMHYSAQQKSIEFACELSISSDLQLYGDPGRIRQILTNLVSNAIKFTQHGSVKLTVGTDSTEKQDRIVFTVEDTGIGIKDDVLANLFRPFQQGDSSTARLFGGSGLGLSISRSLAGLMHGDIELSSQPGVGTIATFSVPMVVATTSAIAEQSLEGPRCLLAHHIRPKSLSTKSNGHGRRPSTTNRRTKSYNDRNVDTLAVEERHAEDALKRQLTAEERAKVHILLAEDNAVNRLIAMRAISKLGFSVSAVWNGKEALEYLTTPTSATHKQADMVLMDCQMPVMDGYCATLALRNEAPYRHDERLRRLPVIAMTASAIQGDREKCFDAGMSDYLAKPVEAGKLEAMLVKWALCRKNDLEVSQGSLSPTAAAYFDNGYYQQWT